ncbi:MAG: hypothetical protein U0793_15745 [Gemmataceae bacterium]
MNYAQHEHHDFTGATAQALADPVLQKALTRLTDTLMAGNRRGYAALEDSGKLRDHAKAIKEHALAHLDRYLQQLEESILKLGGKVHFAATAEDARRIIAQIAKHANCKTAVKSKSMTSEESTSTRPSSVKGLKSWKPTSASSSSSARGETPVPSRRPSRPSHAREHRPHPVEALRRGVADDPTVLALAGRRLLREVLPGRHGASPGPTSPSPRPAASSSSPTKATAG